MDIKTTENTIQAAENKVTIAASVHVNTLVGKEDASGKISASVVEQTVKGNITESSIKGTVEENTVTAKVYKTGPPWEGIPVGGTAGQVLKKASDEDYDTEWDDESGGGAGGPVYHFVSESARDAYFAANPGDLYDGILVSIDLAEGEVVGGTYSIYYQNDDFAIGEAGLNAIHILSAAGQGTLPEITTAMIGKWVRLKKDTTGTVSLTTSGTDTLEGDTTITNSTTDTADFIDVVAQALGQWGVHEARGTWIGS